MHLRRLFSWWLISLADGYMILCYLECFLVDFVIYLINSFGFGMGVVIDGCLGGYCFYLTFSTWLIDLIDAGLFVVIFDFFCGAVVYMLGCWLRVVCFGL